MSIGQLIGQDGPLDMDLAFSLERALNEKIGYLQSEFGFKPIDEKREFRIEKGKDTCSLTHDGNEFTGIGNSQFEAYLDAYTQAMNWGV